MKAVCIANHTDALPESMAQRNYNPSSQELSLTVGSDYVVHALVIEEGMPWLYVIDDLELHYPIPYPMPLFRLIDGAIAASWNVALHRVDGLYSLLLSFPEWANDRFFYSKLVAGEAEAVAAFASRASRG
jgi:hypothetical protein